jgi:LPXTG-motif cell wall-anchored protein
MHVLRSMHNHTLARRAAFVAAGTLTAVLTLAPAALAGPDYPPSDKGDTAQGGVVSRTVPQNSETGVSTGGGGFLPSTGAEVATFAAIGAGALALGTGAVVVARRRQHG